MDGSISVFGEERKSLLKRFKPRRILSDAVSPLIVPASASDFRGS